MKPIFDFIIINKEWIFSGIGAVIVASVFALLKKDRSINQKQDSGNNSNNVQAGRDVYVESQNTDYDKQAGTKKR